MIRHLTQTVKKTVQLDQPELVGYDAAGVPIMSSEKVMEVTENVTLNQPAIARYDEDGNPVFRKHVKDVNILNKRAQHADKVLFTVAFIAFAIQTITLLFPVLWMILTSLKSNWAYLLDVGNRVFISLPHALPPEFSSFVEDWDIAWHFNNYVLAFTNIEYNHIGFLRLTWNSIWITAILTGLSVFMPSMTGYVMSKYKFVGRNFLYSFVIFTMVVPIVGTSAAGLQLHAQLGTLNTPLYPVIISLGGFGSTFLVYYGFFKSVSWSYAEAAQMDGGGPFTIFFRIMLPQAAPIMLTYAITNSINFWNSYEMVMMYMWSYPTLAAGLVMLSNASQRIDGGYPVYLAGLIISMIPAITIFAVFSNKIMGSISVGGLKG